jgi:hypothetical protein
MILVKKIDLKGLRNTEYIQFMRDITTVIANSPACLILLAQYHTELVAMYKEVEKRTFRSKRSAFTLQMQEMDRQRDNVYIGFCSIINGYTYSLNEIEKRYANRLEKYLKVFDSRMDKQNYQAETADISKIVRNCQSNAELQEAVAALSLTKWIDWLKTANEEFRERYMDRIIEGAAAPVGNAKETRKQCNEIYYKLRADMDAYIILKNKEVIEVTKTINELIEQYGSL